MCAPPQEEGVVALFPLQGCIQLRGMETPLKQTETYGRCDDCLVWPT